jgi:hypothetical protein
VAVREDRAGNRPPDQETGDHEGHDVAELKKGSRVTGGDRDKLAEELKKRYEGGESIRLLAESSGRSYGFVHRILNESGATLRGRGGATRRKASAAGGS